MISSAIHGIGVDIEEVRRFKTLKSNSRFARRVYTKNELSYCNSFSEPGPHLAVRFAAKEAILKALGQARKNTGFSDIEILNRKNSGAPVVNIAKNGINKKFSFFISLSHSETKAVAFSVITRIAR